LGRSRPRDPQVVARMLSGKMHHSGLFYHMLLVAESLGKTALEVAQLKLEYKRPGGSPTDVLLTNWGHSNATVDMLVSHLLRAGLRYAAEKLRDLGLLNWYFVNQ